MFQKGLRWSWQQNHWRVKHQSATIQKDANKKIPDITRHPTSVDPLGCPTTDSQPGQHRQQLGALENTALHDTQSSESQTLPGDGETLIHSTSRKKKQDEAHEPECRHVCWQTETILICHVLSKLTCETPWIHTLKWHYCLTFLPDTLVRHSYLTLL